MNDNRAFKFLAIFIVIIVLCYLAFAGLGPANSRIIKGADDIRTGIDIRGGVSAIMVPDYGAAGPQGHNVAEDLSSARAIIGMRLDAQGIYDYTATVDNTNNRIIIDIPLSTGVSAANPRAALNDLGSTGELTFREVSDTDAVKPLSEIPATGNVILKGEDMVTASQSQASSGFYNVDLTITDAGVTKFSEATARLAGHYIGVFIDQDCISCPVVKGQITQKTFIIEGSFTPEEAKSLADKIRFGALPVKLTPVSVDSISAQLGQGSLDITITAGIIAFILICLFMILYYRLPGLIACIALSALGALEILFLSNTGISITLPGIGGIILSLGMGVDANVIIYERIKEELKMGKTLRAAIDTGFKRAFTAIFDSNITTIITAVVLFIMGSTSIKGFGLTLALGVVLSFFSAITITKALLKSVTAFDFAKNKWLYGFKDVKDAKTGGAKA